MKQILENSKKEIRLRSFLKRTPVYKVGLGTDNSTLENLQDKLEEISQAVVLVDEVNGGALRVEGVTIPNLFGRPVESIMLSTLDFIEDKKSFTSLGKWLKERNYDGRESYGTRNPELTAFFNSGASLLLGGASVLEEMIQDLLNKMDPWLPTAVIIVAKGEEKRLEAKLASMNIEFFTRFVSHNSEFPRTPTWRREGQVQNILRSENDNIVHTTNAGSHSKRIDQIKDIVLSLRDQIRGERITRAEATNFLLESQSWNTLVRYKFGLPTEAELNEHRAARQTFVYMATPKEITAFRKSKLGKETREEFSSTKLAKSGIYIFNPIKGESLNTFWFLSEKTLDNYEEKEIIDKIYKGKSNGYETGISLPYPQVMSSRVFKDKSPLDRQFFPCEEEKTQSINWMNSPYEVRPSSNEHWAKVVACHACHEIAQDLNNSYLALLDLDIPDTLISELVESMILTRVEKKVKLFMNHYHNSLGGKVDIDLINKTSFKPYYKHLTNPQKIRLREYINKGEVNEDVLNFQPMTVWLLLSLNSTLNRVRTKKAKIFDSMSFRSKLPKWLLNKILTPPEQIADHTLHKKKKLFLTAKRTWASDSHFAWILAKEDKIFSDLPEQDLLDFLGYCNLIEAPLFKEDQNYNSWRVNVPPNGVGHVPKDLNRHKLKELYDTWSTIEGKEDSKVYKLEKKNKDREWKEFCLQFRDFIQYFNSISQMKGYNTPKPPSSVDWKQWCDSQSGGSTFHHSNDLLANFLFLYGALTRQSPYDSWENFTSFIWQVNRWVKDAEHWHKRQVGLRNNRRNWEFRQHHDVEEYIRNLIEESGAWYDWFPNRGYRPYGRRDAIEDTAAPNRLHQDNEATGFAPSAYKAVRDLWGTWILKARVFNNHKATENPEDQKDYALLPNGMNFFTRNGYTVRQVRNKAELRAEGRDMHHCVGSYHNTCATGRTMIFHIEPTEPLDPEGKKWDSSRYSTLQLNPSEEGKVLTAGQHYSYHNRTVHDENRALATWFVRRWNSKAYSPDIEMVPNFIEFMNSLAKLNGFKSFKEQCSEKKVIDKKTVDAKKAETETEAEEKKKLNPLDKYRKQLGVLKDEDPDEHHNQQPQDPNEIEVIL